MDSRLEEVKEKIAFLENENMALKEINKAQADNLSKWEPLYRLLSEISTCRRFIDEEKAFEEIMKVFNEVNQ